MRAAGDYPVCLIKQTRARFTGQTVRRILRGPGNGDASPGSNAADVDEQPLRAELLSVSQLEHHAKSLAALHEVESRPTGPDRLLPRLAANESVLREAYELVTDAVKRGRRITPAAEWFLDNYHL